MLLGYKVLCQVTWSSMGGGGGGVEQAGDGGVGGQDGGLPTPPEGHSLHSSSGESFSI